MANDRNLTLLKGNLTRDPDHANRDGLDVTKATLATSRDVKRDGEWEEETEYHRVTFFGSDARYIRDHAKKGTRLDLEGRIAYSTTGEGDDRKYWTEVISRRVSIEARGMWDDTPAASDRGRFCESCNADLSIGGHFPGCERDTTRTRVSDR